MQIDRTARTESAPKRPFCTLECDGCTGMCLALYMMLTQRERDEMRRRHNVARVH